MIEKNISSISDKHFARENGTIYRILKSNKIKELTQNQQEYGMVINIRFKDKIRNMLVQDAMAEAFNLEKINSTDKVNHIDGDIYNNNIKNLEFVSNLNEFNTKERIHDGLVMKNINNKLWIREDGMVIEFNYQTLGYDIKNIKQDHQGYISIFTIINGVRVSKKVHRLVAEVFIEPVIGKDFVDHINEDKTDNRVENLRWCTHNENIEYYNTKNGRDRKLNHRRKIKDETKELLKEVKKLGRELENRKKKINHLEDELIKKEKKFKEDIAKQIEIISRSKQGYKNVSGMKFESIEAMVNSTGKPITVNGKNYNSCGSAAKNIVDEEFKIGIIKNKDTISKELRKYLSGRRDKWIMYGRYTIGY